MRSNSEPSPQFDNSAKRHAFVLGFCIAALAVFWTPLRDLILLAAHDDRCTHILVVPFISALFFSNRRAEIFRVASPCPAAGIPLLAVGATLWRCLPLVSLSPTDRLSVTTALIWAVCVGIFLLFYGVKAFRAAAFPLFFLLLTIPIPTAAIDRAVFALQKGSAEASYVLFRLQGMPVVRTDDLRFSLPGVDIEIAEQCSSIRSSISLFLTSLLAGNLFLQSPWRRVALTLLTIPIAIIKNAARIVTISFLGVYASPDFFHGALHQYGGLVFSLVALALFGTALFLLRRSPFLVRQRQLTDEPSHT